MVTNNEPKSLYKIFFLVHASNSETDPLLSMNPESTTIELANVKGNKMKLRPFSEVYVMPLRRRYT